MSRLSIFSGAARPFLISGRTRVFADLLAIALVSLIAPAALRAQDDTAGAISREVKAVFERCGKAVVKIHAADQHSELSGTGFFVDPTGTLYTSYSVAGEADNFTVQFEGKKYHATQLMADLRSGIALLKVEAATPFLPIGKSSVLGLATPVVSIGYPLDLPETPSFGMIAGFDRKYLGRYFSTTHLRVNLPTQRAKRARRCSISKAKWSAFSSAVWTAARPVTRSRSMPRKNSPRLRALRRCAPRLGRDRCAREGKSGGRFARRDDSHREGTPAADSGLKAGDVLLQVGNTPVHEAEDVIDASFFLSAGDTVPITVMRGNEKLTVNIQADFHPASKHTSIAASINPKTGIPLKLGSPAEENALSDFL